MSDLAMTARTLMRGNPHAFAVWYGGLSDDERLVLRAQLGLDAICDAFEQIMEVLCEAWRIVSEAIAAIVEFVRSVLDSPAWRRLSLYLRLLNWGLPPWLAGQVARWWPERWLPVMG